MVEFRTLIFDSSIDTKQGAESHNVTKSYIFNPSQKCYQKLHIVTLLRKVTYLTQCKKCYQKLQNLEMLHSVTFFFALYDSILI